MLPGYLPAKSHPEARADATAGYLFTAAMLTLRPLISTPDLVREYFFSPDTPQDVVDRCLARLQDESYPAFLGTIFVLPKPRRITVPVLVLGAEEDRFFTVAEVRRTAAAYRTNAQILPTTGHNLMLEATWPDVADRIDQWLHAGGQAMHDTRSRG